MLYEAIQLKVSCQEQLESIVPQLITSFIDSSLVVSSLNQSSDSDSEEFDKDQRTIKGDELDQFSKLMKHKTDFSLELLL